MSIAGQPLRLDAVKQKYGAFTALQPTDLEVRAGEFLTLLGPSGSGKTTLLNLTAGYLEPTEGRIFIGDRDVTHLPARRRNIGMVFQNYALFPHMTVAENVAYGLKVRSVARNQILARVQACLALVQMEEYSKRPIQQLSGGQQQRVALARALVIEPDVLLMDEPLGALDKQLRRSVQLELRRLHQEHRRTTIYVTHDQEEALVLSDRVAVMSQGVMQQLGSASEIYNAPRNAFVAGFIGESNLIPAVIKRLVGEEAEIEVPAFKRTLTVTAAPSLSPGTEAQLLLRPEHLIVTHDGEGVSAEIVEVIYLGELTAYTLKLEGGQTIAARQITDRVYSLNSRVRVTWKPGTARAVPIT